jgi:Predicted periplasmic or secreted lipoprotein
MKISEVLRRLSDEGCFLVATRGGHRQFKHPHIPGRVTVAESLDLANALSHPDSSQVPDPHLRSRAFITEAEEGGFIANDPSTGTTTQGDSVEEASANLLEAVQLFLETFPEEER